MSNKPSQPSPIFTFFALIAVIIGIPSATVFTISRFVALNLWFTIVLIIVYEVAVSIIAFIGNIWQQLAASWSKQIASKIEERVEEQLSDYERKYYQFVIYQNRDFDIRGLNTQSMFTLNLEQVFVDLRMVPTTLYQVSGGLVRVSRQVQPMDHSIWKYLTEEVLSDQHFVILGPPGSGKTTLLKHIALAVSTRSISSSYPTLHYKVPILLYLRNYAQMIKEQQSFSLLNAIQKQMEILAIQDLPLSWLEQQLKKGDCLILLDGLDEVADKDLRQQVVGWVQKLMMAYGNNRFIITSRPFGYKDSHLTGVAIFEVLPFTNEQIEQFLNNWYIATEIKSSQRDDQGVRLVAREGAKDLLERMQKLPALLTLATNPLLLTMIATVHRYRSTLPGKRIELYTEMCEVVLSKRQEIKGIPQALSAKQKMRVLQVLAFHMMQRGLRESNITDMHKIIKAPLSMVDAQMKPEVFLRLIEETSGLLLEEEHDNYKFAHLTFQEFLAAKFVHESNKPTLLTAKVNDEWWHETIRLYCALTDATPILQACLQNRNITVKLLILALECRAGALEVQPRISKQLDDLVERSLESSDFAMRQIVAEALLSLRLKERGE